MSADAAQGKASSAVRCSPSRAAAGPGTILKARLRGRLSAGSTRRFALAAAALAAVILAAGAVAVPPWRAAPQEVTLELHEAAVFYSLPPFIAELKHGKARARGLRLALAVEIAASQQWRLEEQQSVIEEAIKARMRHLDGRELEGNVGANRLRDDVLAIVNDAISPAMAARVLYLQFVID